MEFNPFIIVYAAIQFIAFLLVLVGTPLDIFRSRQRSIFNETSCVLLWGVKRNCSSIAYAATSDDRWVMCPTRRTHFRVARVFAVITIGVYCAAFVLGFIMLCCYACLRWVCLGLNIVGFVTLATLCALMVVSYETDAYPLCPKLKNDFTLSSGFFLFAAALCLDLVSIAFLFIPWSHENVEGSSSHSKEGNSQEE
ncbi:amastin-like surface protein, putative [Leishmania panamensis]|uniref:Amastin-like surface protein, putative n=13 Tax=Leishmania panamensis TaxID=5679 RepID=A0AC62A643_LEIPA